MTNHLKKKTKSIKSKPMKQKIYHMVGCSKTSKRNKKNKKYLGGTPFFAYPDNVERVPNPYLAYTGGSNDKLNIHSNPNGENPYLPNTGPVYSPGKDTIRLRSSDEIQTGGKHRNHCKCSACKSIKMKGGNGNDGKYPNGLVGTPYTPNPSTNEIIPGNNNHYSLNTYNNDVSRQMVDVGANNPYLYLQGGKKRNKTQKMKYKGGGLSNFLAQDVINLGRQVQFGMGSAYNALAGYTQPVSNLPWKDQLVNNSNADLKYI